MKTLYQHKDKSLRVSGKMLHIEHKGKVVSYSCMLTALEKWDKLLKGENNES